MHTLKYFIQAEFCGQGKEEKRTKRQVVNNEPFQTEEPVSVLVQTENVSEV